MDAVAFQRAAGSFGVAWTVKFVEAPIDAVSIAYAKHCQCEIARRVDVRVANEGQLPPTGVVLQPAESDWVIVFHQWGRFAESPVLAGINARTLEFAGDDGDQANTCNANTPSKPVVRFQVESAAAEDDEFYAASGKRKPSRPKTIVVSDYSEVFDHYGIQPLFVYLDEERQVVAPEAIAADIVRVDVATLAD